MHERSKKRVAELGEVFTPPKIAKDMCNMIDVEKWSDPDTVFFEPCCGNGNIVVEIFLKRFEALNLVFQNDLKSCIVTLDTLWAVDICPINIKDTIKRVREICINKINVNLHFLKFVDGCLNHQIICQNFFYAMEGPSKIDFNKTYSSRIRIQNHQ